ncbi:hypothetical protein [Flavobacterium sp. N502536]|uniref:hypothetical protein n=1 Tax=Flavobacterium sp. N502536 TaxID=2986837 RepID=UPI002223388C|nr:hypothetical protein [Flavobacterium sp. N502536]
MEIKVNNLENCQSVLMKMIITIILIFVMHTSSRAQGEILEGTGIILRENSAVGAAGILFGDEANNNFDLRVDKDSFRLNNLIGPGPTDVFHIDSFSNLGLGLSSTAKPQAKIHVFGKGRFEFFDKSTPLPHSSIFFDINTNKSGTNAWIGTSSNHGLFIGTNNTASNMYLDTLDNVFVGDFDSYSFPEAEKKYDLFVNKGVLSADYAMAPVNNWSDHVFSNKYPLAKLSEVEAFINKFHHLPNIPSEAEVKANGYSVHEMTTKLLEKVEELTLYIIRQQKEIEELKSLVPKTKK